MTENNEKRNPVLTLCLIVFGAAVLLTMLSPFAVYEYRATAENAYSMLDFSSSYFFTGRYAFAMIFTVPMSYAMLICGIGMIVLGVLSHLHPEKINDYIKYSNKMALISLICSGVYLIVGIICMFFAGDYTLCFIPIVLITIAFIAYKTISSKGVVTDMEIDENALFNLNGNVASLHVYEDHCTIKGKKTFTGFLGGRAFNGSKDFYYCDLTAVQYKPAGNWANGFIQFEYPGSNNGANNYLSENSFVITKMHSDIAECDKAYQYIKEKVAAFKTGKMQTAPKSVSPDSSAASLDDLKKLKELLDMGIITQDEFDAKKKELLGL